MILPSHHKNATLSTFHSVFLLPWFKPGPSQRFVLLMCFRLHLCQVFSQTWCNQFSLTPDLQLLSLLDSSHHIHTEFSISDCENKSCLHTPFEQIWKYWERHFIFALCTCPGYPETFPWLICWGEGTGVSWWCYSGAAEGAGGAASRRVLSPGRSHSITRSSGERA